jgi:hypothetical protein
VPTVTGEPTTRLVEVSMTETVPLPAHKRLQVLLMARLHSAQAGPTIGVALLAFLLALLAASR